MPAADGNHSKAPRHSLTDERILQEALALVDELGLERLTTRALGRRLGVDSTAVYRHFRSKDELLTTLADRVIGSGSQPAASTDGDRSPRRQLRGTFLALRRALLAHPAMTPIAVRRPFLGPNAWASAEHPVGLLRQAGVSDEDAARAYQALLSYTVGHTILAAPEAAPDLYGPLDEQFTYGLDRLLDGLGLGGGTRAALTTLAPSPPPSRSPAQAGPS